MEFKTEIRSGARGYSELRVTVEQGPVSSGVSWVTLDHIAQEAKRRLAYDPPVPLEWTDFDYDDKKVTCPEAGVLVWIVEEFYEDGVTIGYFDGVTFRTWAGSDDCFVLKWAPLTFPGDPRAA